MLNTKQTEYTCKKVGLGSLINKDIIKEEIDSDILLDKIDHNRELIVNNASKVQNTLSQILINVINYVQYSKVPKNFHNVTIKPLNINNRVSKKAKNENIDEFC